MQSAIHAHFTALIGIETDGIVEQMGVRFGIVFHLPIGPFVDIRSRTPSSERLVIRAMPATITGRRRADIPTAPSPSSHNAAVELATPSEQPEKSKRFSAGDVSVGVIEPHFGNQLVVKCHVGPLRCVVPVQACSGFGAVLPQPLELGGCRRRPTSVRPRAYASASAFAAPKGVTELA